MSPVKLVSWFLLMLVSYTMVAIVMLQSEGHRPAIAGAANTSEA